MSLVSRLFHSKPELTASQIAARPISNVRGVTGMSRDQLARYYREFGIFGSDSALGAAEQAVLETALRSNPGPAQLNPQARSLQAFAEKMIEQNGDVTAENVAELQDSGFSTKLVAEAVTVIRDSLEVFGPVSASATRSQLAAHPAPGNDAHFARAA